MRTIGTAIAICAGALVACHKGDATKPAPSASVAASTAPSASGSAASAPVAFEGEIVMNVKDEAAMHVPLSITYDIKADKVRAVPAAPASIHTLSDPSTQSAYAIDDTQKAYMGFDLAKAPAPAKVAKTAKVEKVVGVECEDWSIDDGNEKVDVCVAKGVAFFDLAGDPKDPKGGTEPAWAAALTKEKAFPLRVIAHDKAGKEEYRAEAAKVDRRSLDDKLFVLPPGFKRSDVSAELKTASLP